MQNDHKIVIRADARAMGAVTALSGKVAPRWKSSKTRSGECVSIFPDGTRVPFKVTRTRDNSALNRHIARRNTIQTRAAIDIAIMQNMPTIHEES